MEHYDIAVIGAGPAGATFARIISSKYKVILIDRKTASEESFTKPCGGLLSGDAQKALSRYNLNLPKDILVDPQIFAVKTIDVKTGQIRHYQRFYINLNRKKFDLWLRSLISKRVELREGICTRIVRCENGFEVSLKNASGEAHTINADFVVGADGAASIVRKSLFPQKKTRRYVAIQQWFKEEHSTPFYSCVFDPDTSDCCSWSISKG